MMCEELIVKLAERQALIVHFPHHAAMRENLFYPAGLLQVLGEIEP